MRECLNGCTGTLRSGGTVPTNGQIDGGAVPSGAGAGVRKCRGETLLCPSGQLVLGYLCHLLLEHRCESAHALSNCFFGGVAE